MKLAVPVEDHDTVPRLPAHRAWWPLRWRHRALLSTFIPPLVRDSLGDQRTAIGAIMAIDNVLLLLLMPWAGPASDRASARGRGRLPLVLAGLVLSALGMALLPFSAAFGSPSSWAR